MTEAPQIIVLRSGKLARLVVAPKVGGKACLFVIYDCDGKYFTLYRPTMTFYRHGREHPLDMVGESFPLGTIAK